MRTLFPLPCWYELLYYSYLGGTKKLKAFPSHELTTKRLRLRLRLRLCSHMSDHIMVEAEIDRLPIDLLAHIFVLFDSFTDLAQASRVCKKWKQGVMESLAQRQNLSFAGWKMDDDSTTRLVCHAYNLTKLDIPRSRWSCQITDAGLIRISLAKCVSNLTSISLWGLTGITDEGVVQLVSRTRSLQHLNVGGTFITDESLFAIARSCPNLETIVLWSCRHVTDSGLFALVDKCLKLKSMNLWGTRVPEDCLNNLRIISPALQLKYQN